MAAELNLYHNKRNTKSLKDKVRDFLYTGVTVSLINRLKPELKCIYQL